MSLKKGIHSEFLDLAYILEPSDTRLIGMEAGYRSPCMLRFRMRLSLEQIQVKGLILAQNERWRRGLGMQVERERFRKRPSKVAEGRVMHR